MLLRDSRAMVKQAEEVRRELIEQRTGETTVVKAWEAVVKGKKSSSILVGC